MNLTLIGKLGNCLSVHIVRKNTTALKINIIGECIILQKVLCMFCYVGNVCRDDCKTVCTHASCHVMGHVRKGKLILNYIVSFFTNSLQ